MAKIPTKAPIVKKAFIRKLDPPEDTLFFTSMPKISGHSISTNYQATPTPFSSGPTYIWHNTGPHNISVSAKFAAYSNAQEDVKKKVDWCQALVYPMSQAESTVYRRPPVVLLVVGDWLKFKGIVMQVMVEYGDAYDLKTMTPLEATVSMSMERIKDLRIQGKEKIADFGFHNLLYDQVKSGDL